MDIHTYISSGIVESYVLGLASAEESAELEQLRTRYAELDKAIKEFESQLEDQALGQSLQPPAFVRSKLMESLKDEFIPAKNQPNDLTALPGVKPSEAPVFTIHPAWKYAAAAAIILFLGTSITTFILYNKYDELTAAFSKLQLSYNDLQKQTEAEREKFSTLYADVQTMQNPSMAVIKMKGIPGRESNMATVYWDMRTKEVYLYRNNLPQASPGKQYQLWAIVNGKPVDAGMIGSCTTLCKLKNIPDAQAFAITLEKEGGSATPTMTEMYVMGAI